MSGQRGLVLFAPPGRETSKFYNRNGIEILITAGKTLLTDLNLLGDYIAAGFLIDFYFFEGDDVTLG
jgi:hypothetical protein